VLLVQGPQTSGSLNSYELNADALAALNDAEGSKWAIGGQEASGGYAHGYLGGVSSPNNPIRLILGVQPRAVGNVPEAGSSVALVAFGFGALVGLQSLAKRRKRAVTRG
jgi:hypothetical protein